MNLLFVPISQENAFLFVMVKIENIYVLEDV